MGLFDGFSGSTVTLTPKAALVAGMVYLSGGDGHLDDNEIGDILKVVGDKMALDTALTYCQRHRFQQFLEESARLLSPQQKLCMILNAVDLAMGDGHLAPQEQQMLMTMAQVYQIPDVHLQPYVQALMYKNNTSVFG